MQEQGYYETAQVCMNGHVISSGIETSPETAQKFCDDCGAATITECPKCKTSIRGYHMVPGIMSLADYTLASFCHECGAPYPWTETRLNAAKELAAEAEGLSDDERSQLAQSLDDLIADTPRTPVASARFKKLMAKAGTATANAAKQILIEVVTEGVKKAIWG